MNRVAREPFLRCDACGLESPRLDRVAAVDAVPVLVAPLLMFVAWGVSELLWEAVSLVVLLLFGLLGLAIALSGSGPTQAMCPGCERVDALEPSLEREPPRPPGWEALEQSQARQRWKNRAFVLLPLLFLVSLFLLRLYAGAGWFKR